MPARLVSPELKRRKLCHTLAPDVLAWVAAHARKEGSNNRSQVVERAIVAYRKQLESSDVDQR